MAITNNQKISFSVLIFIALIAQSQCQFESGASEFQDDEIIRYYINDQASNFIYGDKGVENYFSMITKSRRAFKCPIDHPFTKDGISCFQCTV